MKRSKKKRKRKRKIQLLLTAKTVHMPTINQRCFGSLAITDKSVEGKQGINSLTVRWQGHRRFAMPATVSYEADISLCVHDKSHINTSLSAGLLKQGVQHCCVEK